MGNLSRGKGKNITVGCALRTVFIFLVFIAFGISAAEKVDINTAPLSELQKLAGVGPVIAQKIIDARPFYSVDELIKVSGIGDKKLISIKEQGLAWVDPRRYSAPLEQELAATTTQETAAAWVAKPEIINTPALAQGQAPPKIDLNIASLQRLQELTGVGPILAQKIIDARPFYSIDDLSKVRGIGTKILQDIKDQGIAWVDPSLRPPEPEKVAARPGNGLAAAAAQPLGSEHLENMSPKPLSIFFVASVLALVSGAAAFFLKKKLKRII